MKKIIALALTAAMAFSMVACSSAPASSESESTEETALTYKTGIGAVVEVSATNEDAESETGASGQVTTTMVAATFDSNDTIVSISIDSTQQKVTFDLEGKLASDIDLRTKGDKEYDYNMVTYGGSVAEWFEQVDSFEAWATGKTYGEVTGMELKDNAKGMTGTPAAEDLSASCTISVTPFLEALQKAYDNAVETAGVPAKTGLGTVLTVSQSNEDVENETGASFQINTNMAVVALDEAGTVVAAQFDTAQQKVQFDLDGVAGETDLRTKVEKGDDYNMVTYGGAVAEYYAQVKSLADWMVGKTPADITGMELKDNASGMTGTPAAEDLSASCTIGVTEYLKAVTEAVERAK